MDLSVLVEVLQAFQHILQHSGYGGLVQDAGLVFPSGDDVFDHIQHRAWILTTTEKRFAIVELRFAGKLRPWLSKLTSETNENCPETVAAAFVSAPNG